MSNEFQSMSDVARGLKHLERWMMGMAAVFTGTVGLAAAGFFSLSGKVDDGLQRIASIDKSTAQFSQRLDDITGKTNTIATNTDQIRSSIDVRSITSYTPDEVKSHTVARLLSIAMKFKGTRFLLSSDETAFAAAMRNGGVSGTPNGIFLIDSENLPAALVALSTFTGPVNVAVNGAPDSVSIIESILKAR